jgi:hypothetical protein
MIYFVFFPGKSRLFWLSIFFIFKSLGMVVNKKYLVLRTSWSIKGLQCRSNAILDIFNKNPVHWCNSASAENFWLVENKSEQFLAMLLVEEHFLDLYNFGVANWPIVRSRSSKKSRIKRAVGQSCGRSLATLYREGGQKRGQTSEKLVFSSYSF